jgi:acetyl-CoA synthetase
MNKFREQDVWYPSAQVSNSCNLTDLIRRMGLPDYDAFLKESVENPEAYWNETLRHMNIAFDPPPTAFMNTEEGPMWARFFPGAGFNVAMACLRPPPGQDGLEQPAILAEDEQGVCTSVSYRELSSRTKALAAGLASIGIKKGDRVGLLFPSSAEAVISLLAVCYIGGIVVPLYSGFGADAVSRRMVDSGAKVLIAADGFMRKGRHVPLAKVAAEALSGIPSCQLVLAYDDVTDPPAFPHVRWQDLAASTAHIDPVRTQADDPCMIIYTSGTSGKPKGAVHRHAGFPLRVAQDTAFVFDFKCGDRFFWPSDMGWMVGPYSTFAALLLKGALVLYSGAPDWPDMGRLRDTAVRQRVTHFGTAPTAIRGMAGAESEVLVGPAPDIRVLMTGGEPIDEDAHAWLFHRFGEARLPVINYTGGTECSGAILTNVLLRPIAPCRFNSTAPGVDGCVVDSHGERLIGSAGELAIRGPFNGMTAGFWNDPERYVETYWSSIPGMWTHGDLAIQDDDGQYLLLGRSDDVMKISGRRVGPSEIEGSVIDGRMVIDAVAFSVPDPKTGEAMIIFAVPGPEAEGAQDGSVERYIRQALVDKMGASYRPHAVLTLSQLIKTRNGKLVRRLARQAWLGEPPGDLSAVENPAVFDQISALCTQMRTNTKA